MNRHPAEIPLARAALPLWSTLHKELGHDCGFTVSGQLRVAEDAEAFNTLEARASTTQDLGYTHEQLVGASELQARIPQLTQRCRGALLVGGKARVIAAIEDKAIIDKDTHTSGQRGVL